MMNIPFVDLKSQYQQIKTEVNEAITEVIENTAFIQGNSVKDFERSFGNLIGAKHCIGVGNGTDALMISLKSLGIGGGDEVIVPANSFIASSEAISAAGAEVVFVDCNSDTYNIDVMLIEKSITNKTKAIIAVHLYGQPADMDEIIRIANKHDLFVIEDSAQGHLAEYSSTYVGLRMVGNFGNFATFSFYPGKNLGAYGDAGAIVTNDDDLARIARMYANHGRISKYDHEFEGINSRMDGIQGAVLGVKLKYIKSWTDLRRRAAEYYTNNLSDVPKIKLPVVQNKTNPVWHLYVIRSERRDLLLEFLSTNGVSAGIHYPIALPNLQAYSYLGYSKEDFKVASKYQNEILSLPIYPEITKEQQDYIIKLIKDFHN
jgi:dTDP-4-amino-4,6-dideoxygalactose transaminase